MQWIKAENTSQNMPVLFYYCHQNGVALWRQISTVISIVLVYSTHIGNIHFIIVQFLLLATTSIEKTEAES